MIRNNLYGCTVATEENAEIKKQTNNRVICNGLDTDTKHANVDSIINEDDSNSTKQSYWRDREGEREIEKPSIVVNKEYMSFRAQFDYTTQITFNNNKVISLFKRQNKEEKKTVLVLRFNDSK